jgi:hypothetical protein
MISYPFFRELFTVETRRFASSQTYKNLTATIREEGGSREIKMCPLGACCFYDELMGPTFLFNQSTLMFLPSGEDFLRFGTKVSNEVTDFVVRWDSGEILATDLAEVMGV